jgi:hypothetical protein
VRRGGIDFHERLLVGLDRGREGRAPSRGPFAYLPVSSCGAPTGFDSGDPRWRR